jgi:hypothetical protein
MNDAPYDFSKSYFLGEPFPTHEKYPTMYDGWEASDVPTAMFTILEYVDPISQSEAVTLAIEFAKSVIHLAEDKSAYEAVYAAERWLVSPNGQNTRLALLAATTAHNVCKETLGINLTKAFAISAAEYSAVTAWACGSERDDYVEYAGSIIGVTVRAALMDPDNTRTREQIQFEICELIRKVISNPFARPRSLSSELP